MREARASGAGLNFYELMNDSTDNSEQISAGLRKVLNKHGHGFHYAVVRRAEQLSREWKTRWLLDGTEIPVIAGEASTHVDFVLSTKSGMTYLVGECKRADPARARWCFARSPYRWRNESDEELAFDQIFFDSGRTRGARPSYAYQKQGSYQLAFELKTEQKGDGIGRNVGEIEDAVAQVLRSTSGLINRLSEPVKYPEQGEIVRTFVPAIFTTAEIWTTEADLGAADLRTGDLSSEQVQAQKADWVWFTYNRSPRLSHLMPYTKSGDDISQSLRREYARSIAIVGVNGLDDFLQTDLEEWLY